MDNYRKPDAIDNVGKNNLRGALSTSLRDAPDLVCISTGYFNVAGFNPLSALLEKAGRVYLLLGPQNDTDTLLLTKRSDETDDDFTERRRVANLANLERVLRHERDDAEFTDAYVARMRAIVAALGPNGNVTVRRYEKVRPARQDLSDYVGRPACGLPCRFEPARLPPGHR